MRRDLAHRAVGVLEPVDLEEVDAAEAPRAAAHGVGHPLGDTLVRQLPRGGLEEAGTGPQVPRLEQRHHHRQQAEPARVVVRPGDEREHLELGLDAGAVVGHHVHPVVLGEQRRRRPRTARVDEAAGPVELRHASTERPGGQPLQRAPAGRELVVAHRLLPRVREGSAGVQRRLVLSRPVGRVPVALEVDRRDAERPGGELVRDGDHALVDPELGGERPDLVRDHRRERAQHKRAEHHELHDAGPERLGATGQPLRELAGGDRGGARVRLEARHLLHRGAQQRPLQRRQPAGRCDGAHQAAGQEGDLGRVGRAELGDLGARERDGHGATPNDRRLCRCSTPRRRPCSRRAGRGAYSARVNW